ncbi:MAG: SDR family oxidoreductase [Deltaproteobacteria bacterium]|nr:SDR family oxidoreductase [Deltaproteobacteria bacterium]
MSKLDSKRVLITGGAQGIGLEMAMTFAGRGAEIIIADLNEEKLPEAKAKIEALGVTAWGFPVDVTNPASIASLKAQIAAEAGPIDVLVNNAGIVFGGPFTETPLDRHLKTYEVNTLGVVAMTHAFLPDLIERPEAHLVNISSASGFIGLPYGSTYASSKWAVIGFSESIRAELKVLGHEHVHVTIVCPSYIGTGMFKGAAAPKATSILEPEFIAEKVVRAVERNRIHVLEPWMVKITPLLRELLPTALYDRISHLFGADTSMAQWTGHDGDGESKADAQPASSDQPEAER